VKRRENLVYILDWKFSPASGVGKKVIDQINAWNANGLQVKLVVATHEAHLNSWTSLELPIKVYGYSNLVTRRKARNKALKYALNWNETTGFYVRFGIFSLPLIFILLTRKVILELNFKGYDEYKRRSFFLYLYLRLSRKFIFMNCAGACAVTYEIFDEFETLTGGKIKSSVFPNSINLNKIETLPLVLSKDVNLVFIGSPGQIWHGIDRVMQLAEVFKEYRFHVIGPSMPEDLHSFANIRFTGELYGADLDKYLANMDIGISSLAMERNNLREGSPLKTREYLARGLPVIAGYKDTAIDAESSYYLDISNSIWPLSEESISKVENFVDNWKGKRVSKALLDGIDSGVVERNRAKFITDILKDA